MDLKELLPGYKSAMKTVSGARVALNRLIGDEFRSGAALDAKSAEDSDEIAVRLDASIAAFALLNRRLSLLEAMAADTKSDTITEVGLSLPGVSD